MYLHRCPVCYKLKERVARHLAAKHNVYKFKVWSHPEVRKSKVVVSRDEDYKSKMVALQKEGQLRVLEAQKSSGSEGMDGLIFLKALL